MKNRFSSHPVRLSMLAVIVAVAGIGLWMHFHGAHSHDHAHDADASALSLDNGRRWASDAALRSGMERIRVAASPVLAAQVAGTVTSADTQAMAAAIQENVGYIMSNCKLGPKADATLHVFITELLSGAAMLKENPRSKEGAELVDGALRRYPEYFDHPGWKST